MHPFSFFFSLIFTCMLYLFFYFLYSFLFFIIWHLLFLTLHGRHTVMNRSLKNHSVMWLLFFDLTGYSCLLLFFGLIKDATTNYLIFITADTQWVTMFIIFIIQDCGLIKIIRSPKVSDHEILDVQHLGFNAKSELFQLPWVSWPWHPGASAGAKP